MTISTAPHGSGEVWLRALAWLLLGGWIGVWVLFAFVIAPTAFRVLPSTQIAGQLIGPVLTTLHLTAAVAGIALSALAWGLSRTGVCLWLPLAMSALCLVSQYGVTAQIEAIRPLVFGPQGSPEFAARFQLLHQLSMGIYTVVGVAAFLLVGLHARADSGR